MAVAILACCITATRPIGTTCCCCCYCCCFLTTCTAYFSIAQCSKLPVQVISLLKELCVKYYCLNWTDTLQAVQASVKRKAVRTQAAVAFAAPASARGSTATTARLPSQHSCVSLQLQYRARVTHCNDIPACQASSARPLLYYALR